MPKGFLPPIFASELNTKTSLPAKTPHDALREAVRDDFISYGGYDSSHKTSSKSSFVLIGPTTKSEDDRQEQFETALQQAFMTNPVAKAVRLSSGKSRTGSHKIKVGNIKSVADTAPSLNA